MNTVLFFVLLAIVYAEEQGCKPRKPHHKPHHNRYNSSSSSSDSCCNRRNGKLPSWSSSLSQSVEPHTHVRVKPDAGFYPFLFGNSMTPVLYDFNFHSSKPVQLTVLDCFCEGDVFQFYDNGKFLGITAEGCAFNPEQPTNCTSFNCQHWSNDPEQCLFDNHHCKASVPLLPGFHNITLETVRSCDTAGLAYIRVDTLCWDDKYKPGSPDANTLKPCCEINRDCKFKVNNYFEQSSSSSSHHHRRHHNRTHRDYGCGKPCRDRHGQLNDGPHQH